MSVQPVRVGDELRERVQPRLALGPVVIRPPVARELLNRRDRHALRIVRNRLPLGPPRREYSPAQLVELRLGKARLKRTNRGLGAARLLPHTMLSGERAHCLCSFALVKGEGADWTGNAAGTGGAVCKRKTPEIRTSPAG